MTRLLPRKTPRRATQKHFPMSFDSSDLAHILRRRPKETANLPAPLFAFDPAGRVCRVDPDLVEGGFERAASHPQGPAGLVVGTAFGIHFSPIYRGTATAIQELSGSGGLGVSGQLALLPAIALLSYFYESFAVAESEISRERELEADRLAVAATHPKAFATALVKVCVYSEVFESLCRRAPTKVRNDEAIDNICLDGFESCKDRRSAGRSQEPGWNHQFERRPGSFRILGSHHHQPIPSIHPRPTCHDVMGQATGSAIRRNSALAVRQRQPAHGAAAPAGHPARGIGRSSGHRVGMAPGQNAKRRNLAR